MRESALHQSLVQWLNLSLPREAFFFHPMNNPRSAIQGAHFKKLGMRAGIPDLVVLYGGKFVALEVKSERGRLSSEQKQVHAAIKNAGCEVFTVHSLMEAQMALELCGIPLFATVAA